MLTKCQIVQKQVCCIACHLIYRKYDVIVRNTQSGIDWPFISGDVHVTPLSAMNFSGGGGGLNMEKRCNSYELCLEDKFA